MTYTNADLDAVVQMSEDEILGQIAVAYAGGQGANVPSTLLQDIHAAASSDKKSAALALPGWGKKIFNWAWPKVKTIVCEAYAKKDDLGKIGDKDWVSYVIGAIAVGLGLSGSLALLVIGFAVKYGLDSLCAVDD